MTERSRWTIILAAVFVAASAIALTRMKSAPPAIPKAVVRELPSDPVHIEEDDGYVPPIPTDSSLTKLVNRKLPERERLSPDMASRFTQINYAEDTPLLIAILKDTQDHDTIRNEVANYLRRVKCPALGEALMEVLENPAEDERFRAFAAQHLWELSTEVPAEQRTKFLEKLRSLVNDRHLAVRREALWGLVCLKDPLGTRTATQWLESKAPDADALRDLAIRCVQERLDLREKIPVVRQYLNDQNEVIRIAAIVALSQWGDEDSRSAFETAATSRFYRIKTAGEVALLRLAQLKKQSTKQGPTP